MLVSDDTFALSENKKLYIGDDSRWEGSIVDLTLDIMLIIILFSKFSLR